MAADEPGKMNSGKWSGDQVRFYVDELSGTQGKEYPTRFFARDYAGNLLEFSLWLLFLF